MSPAASGAVTASSLLDAAAAEFTARGYAGSTLNRIAARLGLSRQGLLHYYPSKEALFVAVLERDKKWAADQITQDADTDTGSPLATLVRFLCTTPASHRRVRLQQVLQGEAIAGNPTALDFVNQRSEVIHHQVASRVQRLAGTGQLRPDWSESDATTALVALINGLQVMALLDEHLDTAAAFTAASAHFTTEGNNT